MISNQSLFEVEFNQDGKIVDFVDGTILDSSQEERVRERYLRILHYEYKYPKEIMRREVPIQHGATY
jgi:type I restriction enzyme M protein